jgi:hypothetical protein
MASEIEVESVKKQVDIYRQLKEQLLADMKRYHSQGKDDLASIISQTVAA